MSNSLSTEIKHRIHRICYQNDESTVYLGTHVLSNVLDNSSLVRKAISGTLGKAMR